MTHPCQREFDNSQIIIFLVDSEDRNSIQFASRELSDVMNTPDLKDSILLVIANKQDLENCMKVDEVQERLGFHKLEHIKYKNIIGASLTTSGDIEKCLNILEEQYRSKIGKKQK